MLHRLPPWQGEHHACARHSAPCRTEFQGFPFLLPVALSPSLSEAVSEAVSMVGARTCRAGQREDWAVGLDLEMVRFLPCCVC